MTSSERMCPKIGGRGYFSVGPDNKGYSILGFIWASLTFRNYHFKADEFEFLSGVFIRMRASYRTTHGKHEASSSGQLQPRYDYP